MRSFYYYYYFIIYKKIRRDLDLTCIKELCDPAMILEKEKKSRTLALGHAHTTREESIRLFSFLTPFSGGRYFVK